MLVTRTIGSLVFDIVRLKFDTKMPSLPLHHKNSLLLNSNLSISSCLSKSSSPQSVAPPHPFNGNNTSSPSAINSMDTIPFFHDHTSMATMTDDSGSETTEHEAASELSSPDPADESILSSSSPISAVESVFSPSSNAPSRRLSAPTSVSAASVYSCAPEESETDNKQNPKIRDSCLQCAALGLRCTIPIEPLWKGQDRSTTFCRRCEKSGERFCILQHENHREYWADGVSECEVKERVEELLAPKRERWKWCLPKIPPGTRAGLRRVWSRPSELNDAVMAPQGGTQLDLAVETVNRSEGEVLCEDGG